MQSTVSSRPAKRAASASSVIRHMYSCRDNGDAGDGDEDFSASPPADNDDEDLSDVKFVETSKPKIQRRRVGTVRGRGSATLERSTKRTSVRSTNKHQSRILTTPARSTKRTSVISANKQQSQISFISTRKARTKHTVSSTIRRKRQITTRDDDSDVNDGGYVDRYTSAGWGIARSQYTRRPNRGRCLFVVALFASSLFSGTNLQKGMI